MIKIFDPLTDTLSLPGGPELILGGTVVHRVQSDEVPLGALDWTESGLGFHTHRFALVYDTEDEFPWADWLDEGETASDTAVKAVEAFFDRIGQRPGAMHDEGRTVLAVVELEEFPAILYGETHWSWFELFDNYNGDFGEEAGHAVGPLLDRFVNQQRFPFSSVFAVAGAGVVRDFSGTALLARLLTHAVGALSLRGTGLVIASPFINREPCFDQEQEADIMAHGSATRPAYELALRAARFEDVVEDVESGLDLAPAEGELLFRVLELE